MGMLSAVTSFFSSSPKAVDDIFDKDDGHLTKAGEWFGNLSYTDQEKAKDSMEMGKVFTAHVENTMKESTQRSQTRRKVAVEWIGMQVFLIKLNVLAVFIDHWAIMLEQYDGYVLSKALGAIVFSSSLWIITGGIGAFFFGTHLLRSSKAASDKA